MNNFITNISYEDIQQGYHEEAGENSMLIQIVDMDHEFPKPLKDFKVIHQFKFDDETEGPNVITDEQAKKIAEALTEAKEKNMNGISITDVSIELDPRDPSPNRTIEKIVDLTSHLKPRCLHKN